MSGTGLVINVTDELRDELRATETFLAQLGGEKVNDLSHYGKVAIRLNELVSAVFVVQGSYLPLGQEAPTARINLGPDTALAGAVATAAEYLRVTAAYLLNMDNTALSKYESAQTTDAVNQLKTLYQIILNSVRRIAIEDLRELGSTDAATLLDAANVIAAKRAAVGAQK